MRIAQQQCGYFVRTSATTLSQWPMAEINHRPALEPVVLPWNGTTYLPEAGAQQATDHREQHLNEINNIVGIERQGDLLHDHAGTPKCIHDRPSRAGETSGKHPRRTGKPSQSEARDGMDDTYNEIQEIQGYYGGWKKACTTSITLHLRMHNLYRRTPKLNVE